MSVPITAVEMCNIALALVGWVDAITSLTADTNKADRQCNLFYSLTLQEMLELFAWNSTVDHRPLVLTAGFKEYNDKFGTTAPTITAIGQLAGSTTIAAGTHGFESGQYVEIFDVGGMTELNGFTYNITKVTDDLFLLNAIESSNFTAYTSGGSARRNQPQAKYTDAFTYDVPSDFILGIQLENTESAYEIIDQAGNTELITNTEDAILSYVRAMSTDATVTQFTQLFLDAFAHNLAIKLSVPMKGGVGGLKIKANLEAAFKVILERAEIAEAQSINKIADDESTYVMARGSSSETLRLSRIHRDLR